MRTLGACLTAVLGVVMLVFVEVATKEATVATGTALVIMAMGLGMIVLALYIARRGS